MTGLFRMKVGTKLLCYVFLILVMVFALGPLLWSVSASFKLEEKVITYPPAFVPKPFTLDNYRQILFHSPAPRFFLNSLILATSTTVIVLIVALHAGYGASRFNFRGKNGLLFFILAMGFIPGVTVLVPLYLLSTSMGIYDTYYVLILIYTAWRIPTITWLMKGFIQSVPPAMEEAALLDGCSRWGALYRIVFPSVLSGSIAAGIITFVFVWNDFLVTMALTSSSQMRNIQMGLRSYLQDIGIFWGKFMAYSILAILPPIIIYLALHKQFTKGLTTLGGLK